VADAEQPVTGLVADLFRVEGAKVLATVVRIVGSFTGRRRSSRR
jgi:hypothetical protein